MRPKRLQSVLKGTHDSCEGVLVRRECLGDACNEALKPEDVEDAGEVVAERHQAPFAANLVEAADQEMAIAGAALESTKGMLDNRRATAHQFG